MIAMLLHDFVNTERHPSKIYTEVKISDDYICQLVKNHHNYEFDDRELPLLSTLQYYDRFSSSISRKFRFSAPSRYRVTETTKIHFDTLKKRSKHANTLFMPSIPISISLKHLIESMKHSNSVFHH